MSGSTRLTCLLLAVLLVLTGWGCDDDCDTLRAATATVTATQPPPTATSPAASATPTASATAVPTATGTPDPRAQACTDAGGTLTVTFCCASVDAFPDTCGVGACGCAPSASHEIPACECPEDTCWNGTTCTARQEPTPTATPDAAEHACLDAGGTVAIRPCCSTIGDFSETCGPVRSCECLFEGEMRPTRFCECPTSGDCWNGTACVPDIAD